MVKCTLPQRYVLSYIIHHLKWNSNTVTINYTELREAVKVNLRVITAAVSFLCDNDIIYRTDIKDMLIINHNVIFYGSIETFYKNYRLLCRNKPVIKGRKVILNK